MDYELFWTLNPKKLEPYQKKKEIELKERRDFTNTSAWLNGIYILEALGSAFNNHTYPQQPRNLDEKPKTDAENFMAYMLEHNKQIRGNKKVDNIG